MRIRDLMTKTSDETLVDICDHNGESFFRGDALAAFKCRNLKVDSIHTLWDAHAIQLSTYVTSEGIGVIKILVNDIDKED